MVIKRLECKHKCGLSFNLDFHYSINHEDKIIKCICGDKTLSGIYIKKFDSPMKTDCTFKDESKYNSSSSINSNSSINSISSINSSSSINSNSNSNSNSICNSSSNSISISNSNSNSKSSTKVLTRNCNKCNSIKPLTDFDESKYTCRNCTSANVKCLYCPCVVRYDGIRAHVKKQHPDVELTRGFSSNLTLRNVITQTGESCWCKKTEVPSCKYYNFVSFLINNGINIEKVKENINLLKSIDNLK